MIDVIVFPGHAGDVRRAEARDISRLLARDSGFLWVDLEQPSAEERGVLSEVFHFHPLAIEDCEAPRHHPKVEQYGDTLFIIVHGVLPESSHREFRTRELEIFLGQRYLVSYRREKLATVDEVKTRLQNHAQHPPAAPDFLLHWILDRLVDTYPPVLDQFDRQIASLEKRIFEAPEPVLLDELFAVRRAVMRLRRISAHQRDVLTRLYRREFPHIDERCAAYLRDVYDRLVRTSDLAEVYRDLLSGALEAYLSAVANRTNQTMKILTVFTAFFIPLTFLVGVYGMNFRHMPELEWRYGYPLIWGIMLALAGLTYGFFRRRGFF